MQQHLLPLLLFQHWHMPDRLFRIGHHFRHQPAVVLRHPPHLPFSQYPSVVLQGNDKRVIALYGSHDQIELGNVKLNLG
jgi:hypothetical protein